MPATPPRPFFCVYPTTEPPAVVAARFGIDAGHLRTCAADDPRAALLAAPRGGPLVLLHARARLSADALQRFVSAAAGLGGDAVVSPLDDAVDALSPLPEGSSIADPDPAALARAAACFGESAPLPCAHWSPVLSYWPAAALERFGDAPRLTPHVLPDALPGRVLSRHIAVRPGPLRGPPVAADPRFPRATDALERLRRRFVPLRVDAPALPGLDGRPVVLHLLHGWGGGAERFVRDLAGADAARCHLLLRAHGDPSRRCHGERLELVLAADPAQTALRRWPLERRIAATAVAHAEYRAILAAIVADFAVDAVLVSSLIGHALDALDTGLPTSVVCHDYYPVWPVLHADFGDATRRFDADELAAAMRAGGEPLFCEREPARWLALRAAWIEALATADATLIAPSAGVLANLERIAPALAARPRHVIPHGFVPFATPAPAAVPRRPRARPRVLVLGRINGGKGADLLDALLPRLAGAVDLHLLGCGQAGERYFGRSHVHIELDYARDHLPALIARIDPDLALMPATVAETHSYTLSELRALGVPVLATRIGALAERITDGVDGFLVDPDPEGVAARLRALLAEPAAAAAAAARAQQTLRPIAAALADYDPLLPRQPRARATAPADAAPPLRAEAAQFAVEAARAEARSRDLEARLRAQAEELARRADWGHALDREARALGARLAATQARVEALEAETAERARWALALDAELGTARARLAELERELDERTGWARQLDAELATARARIGALQDELAAAQRGIDERTAWAQKLDAEVQRLNAALAEAADREDRLAAELGARSDELAAARSALAERDAQLGERTRERDELLASTSWRITAPLRALVVFARRARSSLRFRLHRAVGLLARTRASLRTRGLAGTLRRIREYVDATPPGPTLTAPPAPRDASDFEPFSVPQADVPLVSIVIPVYNQFAHTRACLEALAAHAGPTGFETIVVDDASSDATPALLPRIGGIRVLRNAANLGFIGACNAGLAAARGEYVVFLNNDTAVQPGWLEALVATFREHPDCGLAGAKLVYPDGRLQEAGGIVFSDGSGWNYGRYGDPADAAFNYVREVDYCSGAAIMLQRELLRELGGFDPLYAPAYYEDTDLAFRVRARGLKVYYQPAATVIHYEGVTSGTDTASGTKRYQVVNQQKFLARWRDALAAHPPPGTPIEIAREHRVRGRILIFDACTPTPDQDSGSVRMVNAMRALIALGWKVGFVPENRAWDAKYTPPLQQLGVEMLYHPWYPDAPQWLAEHGRHLDCCVLSRHYVAAPLIEVLRAYAPQARRVFDTVDLHFLREERYAALSGSAEAAAQARATRAQELAVMRACDLTWVVSESERALLAELVPDVRVDVLSNVHEVVGNRRSFDARHGLWFVGGFQHTPNVDAMLWFCGEIWPRIAAALPDARFHIVGSKMPAEIRSLAGPRVVVHGHVDSLDEFLDGCRVSVAPLRYGAGVKGKINTAMAHGQPVVATPMAVEGMHLVDGDSVLVAETAADFADAVVRLYGDRALWERLSAGGLANVRAHFSFDAARAALQRALPARP